MAKNITILEGRETRTFGGVEKLQTNLTGGGTQYWIPEDEASEYVDTETLEVTENGYYEPTAGSFYDGVDVNVEVEPELEELEVTENGTYTPSGDGFSSVTVNVDAGGSGEEATTHGQAMSAIAQTDINAGDTVAIQSNSNEPVSVSCPMAGLANGANPVAYDGKYIYWNVGNYSASEIRRKLLSKIDLETYEVFRAKTTPASVYYNPWVSVPWTYTDKFNSETNQQSVGTIFTNKMMEYDGSYNITDFGKYVGINRKLFDSHLKCVNDLQPAAPYGHGIRSISSSRFVSRWGGDGVLTTNSYVYCNSFNVSLLGGSSDTYNVRLPQGYSADSQGYCHSWGMWTCGTDKMCFLVKDGDNNKYALCAASFAPEAEYEGTTHDVECDIITEIQCSENFSIGSDTLRDRWVIATDNGTIVLYSDLSVKEFPNLKTTSAVFLAGEYLFVAGACYKLITDDAIMVATTSKGTDGVLGVAQSSVKAGEKGTAIILFS